jgi:NAD(P)-dependent dehydrogenase (short-subunit alcohol dehydrogenase family)
MTDRRRVLVTGASTGIGRATVEALVSAGFDVLATVRRDEDADALRQAHGAAVTPLRMDLVDDDSVRAMGAEVVAGGGLFALVNNAGASYPGPLEYLPIESFRRQLDINLTGQLLVTQVVLPALRRTSAETGDARIVMIGSIGGRIAGPILGAYQAAKHGLVGLAGALRAELAPFGIKVVLLEPGSIATPIWGKAGSFGEELRTQHPEGYARYAAQLRGSAAMAARGAKKGLPPAAVASVIVKSLLADNPAPRRTVGPDGKVIAVLTRLLPFRVLYRMTRGSTEGHPPTDQAAAARTTRQEAP